MDRSSTSSSNYEEVICVVAKKGSANFSVPKSVLVTESPVFKDLLESTNCHEFINITIKQTRLEIPDVDANVFDALLQYLYSKTISQEILDSLADKLLTVADKYKIESLKIICEKALVLKINSTNVIDLLLLADQTSSSELKSSCIAYVIEHSKDVTQTDEWIQQLTNSGDNHTKLIGELYRGLVVKISPPPVPIESNTATTTTNTFSSSFNNQFNRRHHWFHDYFMPLLEGEIILLFFYSYANLPWWVSLATFLLFYCLVNLDKWVAVNISQISIPPNPIESNTFASASSFANNRRYHWFHGYFVTNFELLIILLFLYSFYANLPSWVSLATFFLFYCLESLDTWVADNISQIDISPLPIGSNMTTSPNISSTSSSSSINNKVNLENNWHESVPLTECLVLLVWFVLSRFLFNLLLVYTFYVNSPLWVLLAVYLLLWIVLRSADLFVSSNCPRAKLKAL